MIFRDRLAMPDLYERQIVGLHEKSRLGLSAHMVQDGVSLSAMFSDRKRLAQVLADEVSSGVYEAKPARLRILTIKNKNRLIYSFALTDRIVHGVLGEVLGDLMHPKLSDAVYSYVKGRGAGSAIRALVGYLKRHRIARSDPRTRGLHVLRRDVREYSDSIPTADSSRLFAQIRELIGFAPSDDVSASPWWRLVRDAIRPPMAEDGDIAPAPGPKLKGLPTGSAICPALFNLYLAPMDRDLSDIEGAFYARYSDDFIFAHPDAQVVRKADACIERHLTSSGLASKKEKDLNLFFNGAARSSATWRETKGVSSVTFLGCAVHFSTGVSLPNSKARRMIRDLRRRVRRTHRALVRAGVDDVGPLLCGAVNESLTMRNSLQQRTAHFLLRSADDRTQLRQLDFRIALAIAESVSGIRGVRAFRHVPYRCIRERWKLKSLCRLREM